MTFDPLLIAIPLIGAVIGWITNVLAVKMIFRPYEPKNILGIRIHGLIPRRKMDLARSIGETVERELISHKDIADKMQTPASQERIRQYLEVEIDTFLKDKLGAMPMIGMFLQGDMLEKIKGALLDQLNSAVPTIVEGMVSGLEDELDFKQIVEDKIAGFDLHKLEDIIYHIASKELKGIEVLGGLLGFVIGLGQMALFMFIK